MTSADAAAAFLFVLCWLGYEFWLSRFAQGRGLNENMARIRTAWMTRMLEREVRITDTNIIGHLLNSASFFASTNILIIAAAAGVLFGGEDMVQRLAGVASFARAPNWVVEVKIALVVVTLARGLLAFIWSIRQLNYSLGVVGAAPEHGAAHDAAAYAAAAADLLNGAVAAFNRGVRAYYFALAAAAWLVSPWVMALGSLGSLSLLVWRQLDSSAARSVAALGLYLDEEQRRAPRKDADAEPTQ